MFLFVFHSEALGEVQNGMVPNGMKLKRLAGLSRAGLNASNRELALAGCGLPSIRL